MHDRARRPPEWTAHLSPSQCAVFFSDASGRQLMPDGTAPNDGDAACCWVFDSIAEAQAFCSERVVAVSGLRCELYDARGLAAPPLQVIANERAAPRSHPGRMIFLAVLLLLIAPFLFLLDWRHHWGWILPSLLGVYCVGTAVRLLAWAWGMQDAARLRARQHNVQSK